VAVHLFVFYFGILADDTPPVGLAAYAAAAISRGDPIKTGVQGFAYDIRTALLPFLFLFNTELLLMNVTPAKAVLVFIIATIAMMLFAAATQGWFMHKSRKWESVMLLLIAFTLFRPGYWLDQVSAPFIEKPGGQALQIAQSLPDNASLRIRVAGPDFDDYETVNNTSIILKLGPMGDGEERLTNAGLQVMEEEGKVIIDALTWDSKHKQLDKVFTFGELDNPVVIDQVYIVKERIAKEVFYIPALLMLALIIFLQLGRAKKAAAI